MKLGDLYWASLFNQKIKFEGSSLAVLSKVSEGRDGYSGINAPAYFGSSLVAMKKFYNSTCQKPFSALLTRRQNKQVILSTYSKLVVKGDYHRARGRFVEHKATFSTSCRCYQINNYQSYDLGHTLFYLS
jgi:hypothetical protein